MANEIVGVKSYVTAWIESTWGTKPGSPGYFYFPVEQFGIKTVSQQRMNKPLTGGRFAKHMAQFGGYPQGSMSGALHGYEDTDLSDSLAQALFNLVYGTITGDETISWGLEYAQGPDVANKQFNGVRCSQLTVSGSAQTGRVEWSGNFVGKAEVAAATAQAMPTDLEKLLDFCFQDAVLEIGDVAIGISQFQISRSVVQDVKFLNAHVPNCIKAGDIVDSVSFQFLKNAATYDAYQRAMASAGTVTELDVDIILLGAHNGTGTNTNTRLTLDIPRCALVDVDDKFSLATFEQGLQLTPLKPDSSTAQVTATWDTV